MKRTHAVLFGLAVTLFAAASVSAQEVYPAKLVKIVVPFAAGGSTDLLARNLADRLSEVWKQPVIVENRSGANGVIGSQYVARSEPNGYTLLLGTVTTHAVAATLQPKLPYDVQRDFAPVTELVTIPQLLSVHPSLPVNSLKELVAYVKARPGELNHGGATGAAAHMAMELLQSRAGIKVVQVPYQGSGPAMIALLGGHVSLGFDVVMTTLPHMQSGKLRTLAVTSAARSPLVPQIPTVAESGYPGFEATVWFGLFAPAGTPPDVVRKISEDSRRVLTAAKMRESLEKQGFDVVASSPAEFTTRVNTEVLKWRKVIVDAGIKME